MCHGLPVGLALERPLGVQAQNAALGHQWHQARDTQLGGFFDQPVHALIGGHAHGQHHLVGRFALDGLVFSDIHRHVFSAHVLDARRPFATRAIEQADLVTGLQAQDLDMACGGRGQRHAGLGDQGIGVKKTRHRV